MRFVTVIRADGRTGVLDTQKKMFAHFPDTEQQAHPPRERADGAVARLNDGADTVTGYTWEKA